MSGGGGGGGKKSGGGSQVTGYRYLFGIHMGLVRAADELVEVRIGDRTAWSGSATVNQTIAIDQPNLFGGEKKEGGIQGTLDLMFGGATQVASEKLTTMLRGRLPKLLTVSSTDGGEGDAIYSLVDETTGLYQATIAGVIWQVVRQNLASNVDLDGGSADGSGGYGGSDGGYSGVDGDGSDGSDTGSGDGSGGESGGGE